MLDRHYPGDVVDLTWIDQQRSAAHRQGDARLLTASVNFVAERHRCGRACFPYAERVPNTTPYRVVQWTTGNVGKSSVEAIAKNPNYELVGCYAWSEDKSGVDVGELVGIEPLGVAATNDVDALLALKPDCVVYNPMWNDVDELVRILSAGVNVVASASFITGDNLGDGRDRIEDACNLGGSTMFGSGVSPGFAELLAIVAANGCARVDKVTIAESANTTLYDSPDTEIPVGFGAIDDPNLGPMGPRAPRCSRRRCTWSPTRWAWNSTRSLRDRVREDHRGSRYGVVDHQGRLCGGCLRQLAGSGRRQDLVDSTCGGGRARRSNRTGSSTATAGRSPSRGGRRSTCRSVSCRRRT